MPVGTDLTPSGGILTDTHFTFSISVTDENGDDADPDDLDVTITEPDGTQTSYDWSDDAEVVKVSLGNFSVTVQLNKPGVWIANWHSADSNAYLDVEQQYVITDSV